MPKKEDLNNPSAKPDKTDEAAEAEVEIFNGFGEDKLGIKGYRPPKERKVRKPRKPENDNA